MIKNIETPLSLNTSDSLEEKLFGLKPGLYLIKFSCDQRQFIIFNSENDFDFDHVRKDSRAVHFLRYMSQITSNVFMCMDENYQDRLATAPVGTQALKVNRRWHLNLQKQESLLPTSITAEELGPKQLPKFAGPTRIFSSQNGLFVVEFCQLDARNVVKSARSGTIDELKGDIETAPIDDVKFVCVSFKETYMENFCRDDFNAIRSSVMHDVEKEKEKTKKDVRNTVLNSLALYLIEKHRPQDFRFLEKYFTSNSDERNFLWQKRIVLNHKKITTLLKEKDISKIQDKLSYNCEELLAIEKYLLWTALRNSDNGLPKQLQGSTFQKTSWCRLNKMAEEMFEPAAIKSARPVMPAGSLVKFEKSQAAERIDFKNSSEELKSTVGSYLNYIRKIIKPFTENQSCNDFRQQYLCSEIARAITSIKLDRIVEKFD